MMSSSFWEIFKPLYAVGALQGYTEKDMEMLKELFGALPQVLEDFYCTAGRTDAFHHVQDTWMLPEHFQKWEWLRDAPYMILLNENQGVCRAGIKREDLCLPDPPVYTTEDDKNWILCTPAVSEFLAAALAYEAMFTFAYNPECFYWLSEEDAKLIRTRLTRFPYELESWIGDMKITLYHNAPDNMVAIMDGGNGDLSMLYGAASKESYAQLMDVLDGVGEEM